MFDIKENNINSEADWFKKINQVKKDVESLPLIKNELKAIEKTKNAILLAFEKRIPNEKFGVLFSGGIDSILLAHLAKQKGLNFECYLSVLDYQGFGVPHDLERAISAAKILGLNLKIVKTKLEELEKILKQVISALKKNDVVSVEVVATLWPAVEAIKKGGLKYFMSGTGVEQTHAGGDRYFHTDDVNELGWDRLINHAWESDITRYRTLEKYFGLKLLAPFYAEECIRTAMQISPELKIRDENQKYIFRLAAKELGLPEELIWRRPRPAQYASKFDRGVEKLAKQNKFQYKQDYLKYLYE